MQYYNENFGIYNSFFNKGDLVCREEDFFLNKGKPRYYGEVKQVQGPYVMLRWQMDKTIDCVEQKYLINISNLVDRQENLKGYNMRIASNLIIKSTRLFTEGLQAHLDKFVRSRALVLFDVLKKYLPGIKYVSAETLFSDKGFSFLIFFDFDNEDIVIKVDPYSNLYTFIYMDDEEDFLTVDVLGTYLSDVFQIEEVLEDDE